MDDWSPFLQFHLWKAVGLLVLIFLVSFVYTLRTGRNIADDFSAAAQSAEEGRTAEARDSLQAPPREGPR